MLECYRFSDFAPVAAPHKSIADTTLCGFDIPKDTVVVPNIYSVHHDPKTFPDPDKFNPGHFLNKEGEVVNSDRCIPFGVGKNFIKYTLNNFTISSCKTILT